MSLASQTAPSLVGGPLETAHPASFSSRLRLYGVHLPAAHPLIRRVSVVATTKHATKPIVSSNERWTCAAGPRIATAPQPPQNACDLLPPLSDALYLEFESGWPSPSKPLLRVVGVLGRGACGEVLLAQQIEPPRLFCALKRFPHRGSSGNAMEGPAATHPHSWPDPSRTLDEPVLQEEERREGVAWNDGYEVEWRIAKHLHQRATATTASPARRPPRHVVRTIGLYPTANAQHIALELAAVGSLSHFAPTSTAPVDALCCVRFLTHALDGLAHLHAHGVLHRDIKPDNMFIRCTDTQQPRDGAKACADDSGLELFLGDLGVSKIVVAGAAEPINAAAASSTDPGDVTDCRRNMPGDGTVASASSSENHTVVGTLAYTAPELMEYWGSSPRAAYNTAADVFSLGAVFYCWMSRGTLAGGGGLVRGPQDANRLLQGMLPTLTDLRTFALTHSKDDGGVVARPCVEDVAVTTTTTVSLSASLVLQRQEAVWRSEGQRLLMFPVDVLACVDAMMQLNPTRRPTAAEALRRILAALSGGAAVLSCVSRSDGSPTATTMPFGVFGRILTSKHNGGATAADGGRSAWWYATGLPLHIPESMHTGWGEGVVGAVVMDVAGHRRNGSLAWRASLPIGSQQHGALERVWRAFVSSLEGALTCAFGVPMVQQQCPRAAVAPSGGEGAVPCHPRTGWVTTWVCHRVPCLPPQEVIGRTVGAVAQVCSGMGG